ncbi:helix-turn-helix domain-containing protein [Actinomadura sp. 9N407]|uniref:helix-turn-helix domain-containing protein n=1 Tax=Actinomadura sp. 9N407 TaxID=3375154 RepID=UPI0037B1153B
MLLSRVSTEGVAPAERIAFWEEHNARALVGLTCTSYAEDGLLARQANLRVGTLGLTDIAGNAHVIERTPRICRELPKDSVFASLVLRGDAVFFHPGGCLTVRAGEMVLYDTTKPYLFGFSTSMRKLLVDIPREAFRDRFDGAGLPAPLIVDETATSRALRSLLLDITTGTVPGNVTNAEEVILGLIHLSTTERAPGSSPSRLLQSVVAKDYIDRHLHDPGLTTRHVADSLGISVRHLSRVFAPEDLTPARYILDRRLTRARDQLRDPASRRTTIADIAHRWGFTSQSHFTRAFRARFDQTPGAARPPLAAP